MMATETKARLSMCAVAIRPNGAWAKSINCPQDEDEALEALKTAYPPELPIGLYWSVAIVLHRVDGTERTEIGRRELPQFGRRR